MPNSEINICTEVDHSVGGLYTAIGMGLRIEGDHNSLPEVLQETVLKEDPTGNSCGNFRKMEENFHETVFLRKSKKSAANYTMSNTFNVFAIQLYASSKIFLPLFDLADKLLLGVNQPCENSVEEIS